MSTAYMAFALRKIILVLIVLILASFCTVQKVRCDKCKKKNGIN